MNVDVQYGSLNQIFSRSCRHGDWSFIIADISLEGNGFTSEYNLRDVVPPEKFTPEVRELIAHKNDAIWVQARILKEFDWTVSPSEERMEKTLMEFPFLAASTDCSTDGETVLAYPFICTDYYGRSNLIFSETFHDTGLKARIATSFWDFLCARPDALRDYEGSMFHPGACVTIRYGVQNGDFFCEETAEE